MNKRARKATEQLLVETLDHINMTFAALKEGNAKDIVSFLQCARDAATKAREKLSEA